MTLKDKKILFIGASYFGYSQAIVGSLEKKGAAVDYFPDHPYDLINAKSLSLGIGKKISRYVFALYYKYILDQTRKRKYAYVFFLKGELMSHDFMTKLKNQNLDSVFIFYSWDSIDNFNYLDFCKYFNKIASFDSKDCQKWGFEYLQLFARNEFYTLRQSKTKRDIDMLLLGQYRPERLTLGNKYKEVLALQGKNITIKLYASPLQFMVYGFRSGGTDFLKKLVNWKQHFKGISFISVSSKEWQQLLSRSLYCLDVPHSAQTGMTMRTFEAIAAGSYLISTNKNIADEDFYTPGAMSVIEMNEAVLPELNHFIPIPFEAYSLDNWLNRLFTVL